MHREELKKLLNAHAHDGVTILYNALVRLDEHETAQSAIQCALDGLGKAAIEKLSELVLGVVRRRRAEFRTQAELNYASYAKNVLTDMIGDEINMDDIREIEVNEVDDGAWVTAYYYVPAYAANVGQRDLADNYTYAICENCERRFFNRDCLDTSPDAFNNVNPGEEMPAGRCRHCGGLAYIVRRDPSSKIIPAGKQLPKKEKN